MSSDFEHKQPADNKITSALCCFDLPVKATISSLSPTKHPLLGPLLVPFSLLPHPLSSCNYKFSSKRETRPCIVILRGAFLMSSRNLNGPYVILSVLPGDVVLKRGPNWRDGYFNWRAVSFCADGNLMSSFNTDKLLISHKCILT